MEDLLEKIGETISNTYRKKDSIGVFSGLSGMAMFQFYYSKFSNKAKYADIGEEILLNCLDKINKGYYFPTFCDGIVGMTWVYEHLQENEFIQLDNDFLQNFDNYFYEVMVLDFKKGNYDFLHGGLGYGHYFLKRYKNIDNERQSLKEKYKKYLLDLIDLLNAKAEFEGEKVKWISLISINTKEKGYNLSLSHGISSIISFFSQLYVYDDFKLKVSKMLKGAIIYILSFKNEDVNTFSLFPNWIIPNDEIKYNTRLAWCYGDLGIGIALWNASKSLNDSKLKMIAKQILKHSANRISYKNTMVVDSGICHGSFGNAHLFNKLYSETKDETFKTAIKFWIDDGLKKAVHDNGYAGFKQWKGQGAKWQSELSILEGVAGIGLTILSHLSGERSWDECLLIG